MPANEVERNCDSLNHLVHSFHRQDQNPQFPSVSSLEAINSDQAFESNNDISQSSSSLSSHLPLLPATTYKPTGSPGSSRQLSLTTNFTNQHISRRHYPTSDETSPDPRDFYLQYNDPFSDDGPAAVVNNMTSASYLRKSNVLSGCYPPNNPSLTSNNPPFSSRSHQYHSFSSFNPSRPSSIDSSVARNPQQRQSSLKELVDRFNQKLDPLPTKPPHSRSSSRDGSPVSCDSAYFRLSGTQQHTHKGDNEREDHRSPPLSRHPGRQSQRSLWLNNDSGRHSFGSPPAKQPLFGEIIPTRSQLRLCGQDTSSPRWRRGSDCSIHTPNPMVVNLPLDPDNALSPTSPTAWYLGYSPSFEYFNHTKAITHPPVAHRRCRSNLTPNLSIASSSASKSFDSSDIKMGILVNEVTLQPTPNTRTRIKCNSQSRIPVSTRRLSQTSDSGGSAHSTRANSAMDRYIMHVGLPPKGSSALPKHSSKHSPNVKLPPTTLNITSPSQHSWGHMPSHLTPEESPTLNTYISVPPPKKSPQLRSSRPRQPVSSATTSASRARVVDRISTLQNQSTTPLVDARPSKTKSRRLPELGNVDFAARRRKIQQAFNKTVEENAKREERAIKRRQLVEEREAGGDGSKNTQPSSLDESQVESQLNKRNDLSRVSMESCPETPDICDGHDAFVTPDERRSPEVVNNVTERKETGRHVTSFGQDNNNCSVMEPVERPNENLDVPRTRTPCSDIAPASAVTVDTDITTFDPEPQTDYHQPSSQIHRTVLSQIMQMRESSPSSSAYSDSFSERDDKESIQIMLGRSRYLDESQDNSRDNQDQCEAADDFRSNGDHHRWSTSSWSSSFQDRQFIVAPLEKIMKNPSDPDAHMPISTDESSRTPQPLVSQPRADSPTTGEIEFQHCDGDLLKESTRPAHNVRYSTQMMQQYPDLAKHGGWNSKRVTQLFLQELGFEGSHLLKSDFGIATRVRTSRPPSSRGDDNQKTEVLSEDSIIDPESVNVPNPEYVQYRASLNFREDWEKASPSVAEWMHLAASEESTGNSPSAIHDGTETPRLPVAVPKFAPTEPDEGFGLSINIQTPQDDDSPTVRPPPLPDHSPPPIPGSRSVGAKQLHEPGVHPPVTSPPSISSNNPPSLIHPSVLVISTDQKLSTRCSEESSLHQSGLAPSPQNLVLSATPQDSSGVDRPSVETSVQKSFPSPEQRRLKKRKHIIKELVDTEHTFGQDMTVVVDIYKGTSSSCLDLSQDDIKTLFGNSDQVVQFSMDFQDCLKRAAKSVYVLPQSQRYKSKRGGSRLVQASGFMTYNQANPTSELSDGEKDSQTSIGQVFMENIERMEKVYSEYLRNHDAANKTLEVLLRKKNVTIWLKECRDWAVDLTSAWNLDSLLVKPVQRIVKYPLLLTELLGTTPPDHPDHAALTNALRETTSISVRINDMKKRADVVGQIISGRKRKESDVRAGLSKAFGRRTEKIKAHIGITDMFADKEFLVLSQQFGDNFFQLQLIMRDVELYTTEVQASFKRFHEYVLAIESYINVSPSNYPELESKWCQFRIAVNDVLTVALVDHVSTVRKSVILPMITLLKLHDGPQRVMQKRNKRLMDYVRYKTLKDRGDKADKKTIEQGEQFIALNVTLKEELTKLFDLTGKLTEACLNNFVEIQKTWLGLIEKRLGYIIERIPQDLEHIGADWSADFSFSDAQVLSLGICNGSILAEVANFAGFSPPSASNRADGSPSRRPSTVNSANIHTAYTTTNSNSNQSTSFEQSNSPKMSYESSIGSPGSLIQSFQADSFNETHNNGAQAFSAGRVRTNSGFSVRMTGVSDMLNGQHVPSMTALVNNTTNAGTTYASRPSNISPSLPLLSLDPPMLQDFLADPLLAISNNRGTTPKPALHPSSPPTTRSDGFFSSAMPMTESPPTTTPMDESEQKKDPSVLFLVASLFEFNIDRARREAGYPYLTYVAGEIFDVIGEKGDLWLARNQDDPTRQVGWIWTKHFSKLSG
ncbi:hypothetical protein ACO22_07592 [Paracoccidioides brasiliensis]|uniref:DH domain-containing protein n=1 Tax=Paracoccidioides brasiliensis TaxID=121759 RepID=A0A1D2J495_PARBR|nr:hypothetical protein ACO22_07592 [Paracoccidioides brasiliensis]